MNMVLSRSQSIFISVTTTILHMLFGPALIFTGRYINSITNGIGKCNNFEVWVRLRDLFQPFIACPAGLQWIHILRTSADKIKHVRDGRGGY